MKKYFVVVLIAAAFIITTTACSKESNGDSAVTVENLAGTYALKSLIWNSSSSTVNVYDSLDACEKDNLTKLNADKTAEFIDAGVACNPPEDDNGTWDLRGDSLYFSSSINGAAIEGFDGKTLVLIGAPDGTTGVIATTILEKQ